MREWTEQEEQEMIELARQGDPKANYELSLWALRRAEEEPEETRWNRLAAKCLVKAAKAGYGPAQERMAQVLHQAQAKEQPASVPSEPEESGVPRQPVRLSDARAARRSQSPAPESTARRPEPPQEERLDWDGDEDDAPRGRRGRKPRVLYDQPEEPVRQDDYYDDEPAEDDFDGGDDGAPRWGEKQWRRVEFICIAVCAVLLVLIAVMIITGRRDSGSEPANPTVPVAGDANTAGTGADASPTPEPGLYPDDETLAAIQKADLEVYPAESDYVSVPTTATVKVDSQSLRLRTGPSTTYVPPICNMEDGTTVDVFAIKNNWSLVLYKDGEDGPVYGWCSSEYLIVTSGAADNSSVG